jgi:hypothetical protein
MTGEFRAHGTSLEWVHTKTDAEEGGLAQIGNGTA